MPMADKAFAKKMYLKPGMQIGVFNAPDNLSELLGELPDGISIVKEPEGGNLDIVLGFIEDQQMLETYFPSLKETVKDDGAIWIAYHKNTSRTDSELSRSIIYNHAQRMGLEGVAMVSISEEWSGFRFKKHNHA